MKPRIAIGMSEFAELPKWIECRIPDIDKATIHKGIAEIDFPTDFWEFFDKKKDVQVTIPGSNLLGMASFSDSLDTILMNPLTGQHLVISWQRSFEILAVVFGDQVVPYEEYMSFQKEWDFWLTLKIQYDKNLQRLEGLSGFGSRNVTTMKK